MQPKILCDGMVGRLARWLRLAGIDCAYAGGTATDDEVLARCRGEDRWLVTRDADLVRRAPRNEVRVVSLIPASEAEEIAQVAHETGADLDPNRWFSRCTNCNEILQPLSATDASVRLPPSVSPQARASVCPACAQAYWDGSHAPRIRAHLEEARRLVQMHL